MKVKCSRSGRGQLTKNRTPAECNKPAASLAKVRCGSQKIDALNASQSRSVATTLRLRISTCFHDLDGYRWELSVQEESDEMTSLAQTGILML